MSYIAHAPDTALDPFTTPHPTADAPHLMPDIVAHMSGHITRGEDAIEALTLNIIATWDSLTYLQQVRIMSELGEAYCELAAWKGHLRWYLSHTR